MCGFDDMINKRLHYRFSKIVKIANVKEHERVLDLGCGQKLLLDYLQSNLLPQYSQEEINIALEIGRMHGIRSRLFHVRYLEWATHERGEKFSRLKDICSEILRFELGITLKNDLEKYFEGAA